jgi:transcriptional regulator with XRE-family HTH domain
VSSSASLIREARLRAGLSQGALGERVGKDRAQIARWERGGNTPGYETLRALIRACGFEFDTDIVEPDPTVEAILAETLELTPRQRLERVLARPGSVDPFAGLRELEGFGDRYVLIGSLAGVVRGTDEVVRGVDICADEHSPLAERVNRVNPPGLISIETVPRGSTGYDDLRKGGSVEVVGDGVSLTVASAADLARLESARGDARDRIRLKLLRGVSDI